MSGTILALLAALGGGAIVKLIEIFFIPKTTREDFAYKLREELRADIKTIRDERDKLENELDEWKAKYYDLLDKHSSLTNKYNDLLIKYEYVLKKLNPESNK